MRFRIRKTFYYVKKCLIYKSRDSECFWMPASAKKVIIENSKVTRQSYEGANCDLLFQLIISHGWIQFTLSLICIIFFGEQSPSCRLTSIGFYKTMPSASAGYKITHNVMCLSNYPLKKTNTRRT